MATRRTILLGSLVLTGAIILATATGLWRLIVPLPDQKLDITPEVLAWLERLAAEPKYAAEPDPGYTGILDEPDRLIAEAQLNGLLQRLMRDLKAKPSKKFVLREFKRTLAQFDPADTKDRERICRYMVEIMDILGIVSSDGVLNRWLYGPILGWLVSRESKESRAALAVIVLHIARFIPLMRLPPHR